MTKKIRGLSKALLPLASVVIGAISSSTPLRSVAAAEADVPANIETITVQARRRDETLIAVPIAVTALTLKNLNDLGIRDLAGVARTVPSLVLGSQGTSIQGGTLELRGIGASDINLFGDQAVGFLIDGLFVTRANVLKMSQLDPQQVEVLKGPQALYFGKNSPGGIVDLRSADPTDHFEAGAKIGYEFNAHEVDGQGYISIPLNDSLGLRVAVGGSDIYRGWITNIATPGTIYEPTNRTEPRDKVFNGRITLKYDNAGRFKAKFKFAYSSLSDDGFDATDQVVACNRGAVPLEGPAGPADCTANGNNVMANLGTRFGTGGANTVTGAAIPGVPQFGLGVPYGLQRLYLSSLEMSYELNDKLSLASLTGYYDSYAESIVDFDYDTTYPYNPVAGVSGVGGFLPTWSNLGIREVSQELRLTSSYDGPLNFMVGGYYQHQAMLTKQITEINAVNPIMINTPFGASERANVFSPFASLSYKPIEKVELSGGVRYTDQADDVSYFRVLPGSLPNGTPYVAGQAIPTTVPSRSFHNVSPEVTLSWRPTDSLTAYGSWKRGFLSGNFNPSAGGTNVAVIGDRSYGQETVQGPEIGVKSSLWDGTVRTNLAAFSYKISGLQATHTDVTGVQTFTNAGAATSQGVEFDTKVLTGIKGLSVNAQAAYLDAHYTDYKNSPCYGGETPAQGCNLVLVGTAFTQTDLTGHPLPRAPKWALGFGGNYDHELSNGNTIGLTANTNYSSSFYTDYTDAPSSRMHSFWLLDASVRYEMLNGVELSLVGRNLTNKYFWYRSNDVPLSGAATGTVGGLRSDTQATTERPREIWLQVSYKFR